MFLKVRFCVIEFLQAPAVIELSLNKLIVMQESCTKLATVQISKLCQCKQLSMSELISEIGQL
jgi:hypothetical protein